MFFVWSVVGFSFGLWSSRWMVVVLVCSVVSDFYGGCGLWSVVIVLRFYWSVIGFIFEIDWWFFLNQYMVGGLWSMAGRWFCTTPKYVTRCGNKQETYHPKFFTIFYQIQAEL